MSSCTPSRSGLLLDRYVRGAHAIQAVETVPRDQGAYVLELTFDLDARAPCGECGSPPITPCGWLEQKSTSTRLAITSAAWDWFDPTDQLRTTTADVLPQLDGVPRTPEISDWTLCNRGGPIWGSRGREFKSRQPDRESPNESGFAGTGGTVLRPWNAHRFRNISDPTCLKLTEVVATIPGSPDSRRSLDHRKVILE